MLKPGRFYKITIPTNTLSRYLLYVVLVHFMLTIGGCATGPSPEQIAAKQARLEKKAMERKAQQEKIELEKKQLAEKRQNVLNNTAIVDDNSKQKAQSLLTQLEALVARILQQDSPPGLEILYKRNPLLGRSSSIIANTSPILRLDVASGKMTVKLNARNKREFLLSHVKRINEFPTTSNIHGVVNNYYSVTVNTGDSVIRVNSLNKWKNEIIINADSAANAAEIKRLLEGLVALYRPAS